MVYWMWMYCWAAPLQAVVTTVLLYMQLGWPIFVCILPLQKKVMGSLKSDMLAASKSSDERIKLITEIIQGVQVVKLQAWEDIFAGRVETTRATELKHRRTIAFLKGANTALTECAPIISTIATFAVYGLVSPTPLTAAKAFTALSLFNILRMPFSENGALTSAVVKKGVSCLVVHAMPTVKLLFSTTFYRPSTRMSHGLSQTNVWSSFYMTKERPWCLQRTKRCAFLMQIRSSCSRMVRSLFKEIFVGPRKSRNSLKSSGLWTRALPRASQIPLRRYQWLWTM